MKMIHENQSGSSIIDMSVEIKQTTIRVYIFFLILYSILSLSFYMVYCVSNSIWYISCLVLYGILSLILYGILSLSFCMVYYLSHSIWYIISLILYGILSVSFYMVYYLSHSI